MGTKCPYHPQFLEHLNRGANKPLSIKDAKELKFGSLSEIDGFLDQDVCLELFKIGTEIYSLDENAYYMAWNLTRRLDKYFKAYEGRTININFLINSAKNAIIRSLKKGISINDPVIIDNDLFESVKDSCIVYNDAEYNEYMLKTLMQLSELRGDDPKSGLNLGYAILIERLKGVPMSEISNNLGKSIDAVTSSFFRALKDFESYTQFNPPMELHYF